MLRNVSQNVVEMKILQPHDVNRRSENRNVTITSKHQHVLAPRSPAKTRRNVAKPTVIKTVGTRKTSMRRKIMSSVHAQKHVETSALSLRNQPSNKLLNALACFSRCMPHKNNHRCARHPRRIPTLSHKNTTKNPFGTFCAFTLPRPSKKL